MPKQYVLCGRLLPPITTRRLTALLSAVLVFAIFSVIFILPSVLPTGPSLSIADHMFSLPFGSQSQWKSKWSTSLNPFRPKSHAPPRLEKDSHQGSSWSTHWSWLTTPFSSSYTLDEDRALLPPLPERPPIYCYYDTTLHLDQAEKEAESALLLTWRRAWWAQGFRPIILSPAEAMNNPRYEELQGLGATPAAKADIMRWLAWENMDGGLLSQCLAFPMAAREDALLTFLRRGQYPTLTRWEGLGDGLFAGSKEDISNAIKLVLANPLLVNSESFLEAIPPVKDVGTPIVPAAGAAEAAGTAAAEGTTAAAAAPAAAKTALAAAAAAPDAHAAHAARAAPDAKKPLAEEKAAGNAALPDTKALSDAAKVGEDDYKKKTKDYPFTVDSLATSIACYDAHVLTVKYQKVGDEVAQNRAAGLQSLNQLVNAHLHVTWQNTFTKGIAVLKPQAEKLTGIVAPGKELAERLAQCSVTPVEASCPPNLPNCNPCVAKAPMPVHTPPTYRNVSTLFTIGAVPHPYTYQSVTHKQGPLDVPWLRRKSRRDAWLYDVTKELLGTGVSSARRVLRFKEAVAGDYGRSHTLWFAAEEPAPADVDWRFGFVVPQVGEGLNRGESPTPVPGPERLPPPKLYKDDGPVASPEALLAQQVLLDKARQVRASKEPKDKTIRDAVEAWNIGDMEAWKFARAYLARADAERVQWEKEEAKYANGAGSEKGRRDRFWE